MSYAVPTLIACAIAAGFCYTISGFFASLRLRPARMACFIVPILLSAALIDFPNFALIPLGDFISGAPLQGFSAPRGGAAATAFLAVILSAFTLLVTALIGQILLARQNSP